MKNVFYALVAIACLVFLMNVDKPQPEPLTAQEKKEACLERGEAYNANLSVCVDANGSVTYKF